MNDAIVRALSPIEKLCEKPGLRVRWRTKRERDRWSAEVNAGYYDADWQPRGATPLWAATGATEIEALEHAVGYAAYYWGADNGMGR